MSNEAYKTYTTGITMDGYVFRRSDGYVWNPVSEAFEVWGTGSRTAADYQCIDMDETASGYYLGDFPVAITTEAQYDIQYRQRAGTNPANSDTILTPVQSVYWTGTTEGTNENSSAYLAHTTDVTVDGYVIRRSDGYVWYPTTSVFEEWGTSDRDASDYAVITMAEGASGAGYYVGDFPSGITTQVRYDIQYRERAGATPADSDTILALQSIYWEDTDEDRVVLTKLANYTLAKIGGAGESVGNYRIRSIDDTDDKTAVAMLEMWPQVRKEVICRADWTSATKYAELGAEVDVDRADWEYAFNLPSDYLGRCVQLWEDYHSSTDRRYAAPIDKEVVQGRLFTNVLSNSDGDSAYIRYVFNLTNVAKFDPLLYNAVATKWAAEICCVIRADGGQRRVELLEEYERFALDIAQGEDAVLYGENDRRGGYAVQDARNRTEDSYL